MRNWHIIFPNIVKDILTQKRTVLHLPYSDYLLSGDPLLVGDHLLIHSDNTTDKICDGIADFNIYANVVINNVTMIKVKDISKESLLKMNIDSYQEYFERLCKTYSKDNLTPQSDLFEIEFEYCQPLSEEDNEYFTGMYKSILTRNAYLLQSTQQTEYNNS